MLTNAIMRTLHWHHDLNIQRLDEDNDLKSDTA